MGGIVCVSDFNIASHILKQRISLGELYSNEVDRKQAFQNTKCLDPIDLPNFTRVLLKQERPPGKWKLFQPWKGIFYVKKKLDNDSYLIVSEEDKRKSYIAYRGRLKVLGSVAQKPVHMTGTKKPCKGIGQGVSDEGDSDNLKPVQREDKIEDNAKNEIRENLNIKRYNLRARNTKSDFTNYY